MCDQGQTLTFSSKNCEIKKKTSGKLVATTIRTPNNVYILNKMDKENCCMGQIDAQANEEYPFSIDVKRGEK